MPEPTRVIAQSILTGDFLHWDLPVDDLSIQWTLSGPTVISGSFPVEVRDVRQVGLDAWSCWLHVEEDGIIRASGILQPAQLDENEKLTVDAVGPHAYLKDTPYLGSFNLAGTDPESGGSGVGVGIDPADIVRAIWAEAQSSPDSELGVTVVGSTGTKLGTPKKEVDFTTGSGETVSFDAGPYSKLDWWEHTDCAQEVERLCKEVPFDFVERSAWNADKSDVLHSIELGFPRIGSELSEVRFAQEENLRAAIGPEEPDDRYASRVVVLGKGEGTARVRGEASRPLASRLRRTKTIDDKTIDSVAAANALALSELNRAQALADVTEVTALARHPNATLGSYGVGDDVLIEAEVPYYGYLRIRQRVLGIVYAPGGETVKLQLRSASSFEYGAPATS